MRIGTGGDRATLDADLCVIGSGPAGLSLASEFIGSDCRVAILESGGWHPSMWTQSLCQGSTVGDLYAAPELIRLRAAGGTTRLWNSWIGAERAAKFVRLDPIDFEERSWLRESGWPFRVDHLDAHYARAENLCGLAPRSYRAEAWTSPERPVLPLLPDQLVTGVYQLGLERQWTESILQRVSRAANIVLLTHTTALELVPEAGGRRVAWARARRAEGGELEVRARRYVLATGGIENARLMLLSARFSPRGAGNESGLVGRCFMDHPRDLSCRFIPRDPGWLARCAFYDVNRTPGGVTMGRVTLHEALMRKARLMSVSAVLRPRLRASRPDPARRRARWMQQLQRPLASVSRPSGPLARAKPYDYFELQLSLEQAPDPENRVTLGGNLDALGQQQVEIHWRWREADRDNHERVVLHIQRELARAGLGRLIAPACRPLEPNAHHHLGTTRMHRDPRRGVVDADSRVHGIENLYVAGSSVFPTGGSANPTLTIVALALRLADHLKSEMRGAVAAAVQECALSAAGARGDQAAPLSAAIPLGAPRRAR